MTANVKDLTNLSAPIRFILAIRIIFFRPTPYDNEFEGLNEFISAYSVNLHYSLSYFSDRPLTGGYPNSLNPQLSFLGHCLQRSNMLY
jgi:hypothetical protein